MKMKVEDKEKSSDLWSMAWKKFKRNKPAMMGLYIIIFAAIVAILGPLIRKDSTPKSNDQHISITLKRPGFSVMMLKVYKNEEPDSHGFFHDWIWGKHKSYNSVPIVSFSFSGADIAVEKYTGNIPNNGPTVRYNLANVLYSLDLDTKVKQVGNDLIFYTFDGKKHKENIDEMRKKVEDDGFIYKSTYLLGTDLYGRDFLSRLMAGTWISLSVGLIAVSISIIVGVFLGALAGYFGGWVDDVIMWLINVIWSIPTLLLIIAVTLVIGKNFWQVFIVVGLTMWVEVARIVRGQVFSIREEEFVEAGRALGFKNARIIFKHILPNTVGPVVVIAAANFASAILIEAGLSYLGLGAAPPQATWGKIISAHQGYLFTGQIYLSLLPGICIMLMVLSFIFIGNGLRDALDTKSIEDSVMGV